MAYGDPGQSLADVMLARKQNQEQQFFGNLLQYGMSAGGQFDVVDGDPVYTGGTDMPDKTALWNSYLAMKGGRISPADVQNFESQYTQASAMRTQKQMSELNKLRMKGFSSSKIRDTIEDSPVLYKSLMDLVSNLEASGDENAFAQAQMVRGYLPDMDPSIIGGLIDEPGMLGRVGLPLALAGGVYGTQFLRQTPQEQIDAAKKARADRASITKEIKEQKTKLSKAGRSPKEIKADLATANKNLNAEKSKNVAQRNDQKMKDLRKKVSDLKAEQKTSNKNFKSNQTIQKKIDSLEANKKGIKIVKPEPRYKSLMKKVPKGGLAGGILGYAALAQGGALGEYLGGETGREIGRSASNVGFLGMAGRTLMGAPAAGPLGLAAKGAGAAILGLPALYDIYQQSQGK